MRLWPSLQRQLAALRPEARARLLAKAEGASDPLRYVQAALHRAEIDDWRRAQAARRMRGARLRQALSAARTELAQEQAEAECRERAAALGAHPKARDGDIVHVSAALARIFEGANDAQLEALVGGPSRDARDQWVRRGLRVLVDGLRRRGVELLPPASARTRRWLVETRPYAKNRRWT